MPTLDKDYETRKLMMEFVDEGDSHVYHDITPKKRENKLRKVCDRVAARIGEAIHSTELLSSSKSFIQSDERNDSCQNHPFVGLIRRHSDIRRNIGNGFLNPTLNFDCQRCECLKDTHVKFDIYTVNNN